jgi:hypothetical protein
MENNILYGWSGVGKYLLEGTVVGERIIEDVVLLTWLHSAI